MGNSRQKMMRLRGEAINAYAGIEGSLCGLLALMGDMSNETSKIIFFRIVNTRARYSIIKALKKKKFGNEFEIFWKSLFKLVAVIDKERNAIVHWHVRRNVQVGGPAGTRTDIELYRTGSEYPQPTIREEGLQGFIAKAEFLSSAIQGLRECLAEREEGGDLPSKYHQALVYPDSK